LVTAPVPGVWPREADMILAGGEWFRSITGDQQVQGFNEIFDFTNLRI
jgi:hypothetical protein